MVSLRSELKMARGMSASALLLVLLVIFMGGWTRISDAGLSCPDWPGCFGFLAVPNSSEELMLAQQRFPNVVLEQGKSWLEMLHRYLAGGLGLLITLMFVQACRLKGLIVGYPVKLSALLLMLVIVQALLGMWTVTLKLLPIIVTAHLMGGLLTCVLLLMFHRRVAALVSGQVSVNVRYNTRAAFGVISLLTLLVIQILLGGWTSSNYAGWGCSDWLGCNPQLDITYDYSGGFNVTDGAEYSHLGGNLPLEARGAIQIVHRLMALFVLVAFLVVHWCFARSSTWYRLSTLALCLIALQMLLGVTSIVFAMPSPLAMAHHVTAVVLLLVTVAMLNRVLREQLEVGNA